MPECFKDPYIDPKTGVLRNLIGATTYDELQNAEGEFVALRMGELFTHSLPELTGTLGDFRQLHRALFQDLYDWAGKVRTGARFAIVRVVKLQVDEVLIFGTLHEIAHFLHATAHFWWRRRTAREAAPFVATWSRSALDFFTLSKTLFSCA